MKQKCLNCGLIFYPTKNNYVGYPDCWHTENVFKDMDSSPYRVFHSRWCMDQFLSKHSDIIIPIFKQIKESEDINNARTRENQAECEQATSP